MFGFTHLLSAVVLALHAHVPTSEPLFSRIDRHIAAGVPNYKTAAAPLTNDEEFLRRVYLDLAGTLPTIAQRRDFLADLTKNKRTKLIDKLLAGPEYSRRMAWHFDTMLMERRADAKVPRAAWEQYLRTAFAENRPYDVFVRELLSNDGADPKTRPAAKFLLDRDLEPHLVTKDIGRVFLGRNLQCAQCHDHPAVDDYTQADYYGIQAFLNRSFLFPNAQAATAVIAEKADGDVTYVSVFDKAKKTHNTMPRVPGGKAVSEAKLEKGKEYKVAPAKGVKPVPTHSRRALLAATITAADNPAFARNAVNRIWAMLMGRGLVHPLDWDHTDNPPSHPELLNELAVEFVNHKYDLKWLVREIVLSKTYQRSSELPSGSVDIAEDRYLVAILKPLSPEQFGYASMQATGHIDVERTALGVKGTVADLDAKLSSRLAPFRSTLGGKAGDSGDTFSATLDQTLFLKYNSAVRALLSPRAGNLTARLAAINNQDAVADELFAAVLTRQSTADERGDIVAALKLAKDRSAALDELVWALLASAEFRFNH